MRSLIQVLRDGGVSGEELPPILPLLHNNDIRIRRGQLQVIAGQPGRGKTLLALWYAVHSGVNTLYFSADSDQGTIFNRALATYLEEPVSEIKARRALDTKDPRRIELGEAAWDLSQRLRIQPDPSPTMDDIFEEVLAYVELTGDTPELIVIDNASNVVSLHENEWTGLRDTLRACHSLARDSESALLLLHHTSEGIGNPTRPGPMKATMGKVNALPEMILTVAMDGARYHVAAVKNRDGVADPNADDPHTVYVYPELMSLYNTHADLEAAKKRQEYT